MERNVRNWGILVVIAAVLLIRLPFLNQAIQGDDVYYLAGAQYSQIDPLHPSHARYVFGGDEVSMQGHPHPPLNVWCLAGLLALLKDIYETPFHAAYIVFSLIAALSMWSLARRFSPHPLAATLLFVAVPAFVVNGNSLESDLPFLAFWMASTALFVGAVDSGSGRRLAASAAAAVLAALAAYQSVVLVPVLGIYLWARRRAWRAAWIALLAAPLTLGLWQLYERISTGEMPVTVLAGYFQTYALQTLAMKVKNAAALTGHMAWLVFPALAVAAFRPAARGVWLLVLAAAAGAAAADWNPLFWASVGVGTLVLCGCVLRAWKDRDPDTRFLAAWVLIFFAGALVLFFAGSARYLLPAAAPVAVLASRSLSRGRGRLMAAAGVQLAFSLGLSVVNYQHWDGYRQFARSLSKESEARRVWINGEWGLRFYFEADGGLPLVRGQAVRPGDMVVSSELAMPIPFSTGGGALVPVAEREIRGSLPFRLTGLGARSGYSSVSMGLRPFDVMRGPIDRVRAAVVVERKPVLSYLPMNAPEADQQIVSGIYQLEGDRYRWMAERAVVLLKRPERPAPLEVSFYISPQSPARKVEVSLDGRVVAGTTVAGEGTYKMTSEPVAAESEPVSVVITADKSFSVPGDQRRLSVILTAVGFRAEP
ncbi:MAG: glycosyltransferase family 39 protein [Bryobacteraceae bacterium]